MRNTIHLDHKDETTNIARRAFPGYTGRTFKLIVTDQTINTASYWSGGTRSYFVFVSLSDNRVSPEVPAQSAFDKPIPGATEVSIPDGFACVEHCLFCGKDHGLRIYIGPTNAAKLIPETVDITEDEKTVLKYTINLKNSYGGETNIRFTQAARDTDISADNWELAKSTLISRKMLNKAGAVTVSGRNAIPSKYSGK